MKKATHRDPSQAGLFSIDQAPLKLPVCDEMSRDELLSGERRVLGAFVSGHPVDPFKIKHAGRYTHGVSQHHQMIETDGRIVVIGLVVDVIERGRIYWIKIEDETGEAEILCFSDEYERFRFALSKWDISAIGITIRRDAHRAPALQLKQATRLGRFAYEPRLRKITRGSGKPG